MALVERILVVELHAISLVGYSLFLCINMLLWTPLRLPEASHVCRGCLCAQFLGVCVAIDDILSALMDLESTSL